MRGRVLAGFLVAGLIGPATAPAVLNGGIDIVSRPSGFGPLPFDGINEASVGRHAFSADGCFVVFTSDNDVLSALDDDNGSDVFRANRCAPGHPVELVSATKEGVAADSDSRSPSISADGKKVEFTTSARNLLPPGTTVDNAVVVKNMDTGDVTVAGRSNGPAGAIADAFEGVISGDGTAVAFTARGAVVGSNATGIADEDDIYVRYLGGDETRMASVIPPATRGGADGDFDISYDGKAVALITETALNAGDSDGHDSAYLMRNLLGTPTADYVSGTERPRYVAMSGDATRVAFADSRVWMTTCNPACGAPSAIDSATPPTGTVSNFGIGFPTDPGVPKDVFWSTDRGLIPADTDGEFDFYILDLGSSNLFRVPHHAGGVVAGDFHHGDAAAFDAADPALPGTDGVRSQVFTYDDGGATTLLSLPDGETRRGNTFDTSIDHRHAVSESGRFVVMHTSSPGLGAPSPAPGRFWIDQIIVRDVAGGVTTNVSTGPGGEPANRYADEPSIDATGDRVAFESGATNLDPGVSGTNLHVYARDLATGALQRVDRTADGGVPADGGHDPIISGDGAKVIFISDSPDLPDADGSDHAYVADLATGTVTLVDRTAEGVVADGSVRDVDIAADGSRVAFISNAMNLGGFATSQYRVFVRDLSSGAVTFASPPQSGTPSVNAFGLTFSADAGHVGWIEDSPGFGYGSDGLRHVFVRDLAAGTTTLASVGGPTGSGGNEESGELDRTGTHLAFLRRFDDGSAPVALLRDLAAGTTTDLLPAHGKFTFELSVSPDGHCVAVNSNAANVLPAGNVSPDFDQVYLLGLGADCPPVPPASGGPGATDRTAPVISRLRMTRKRFAVAAKRTALVSRRAKRGSAFLFTLSESARTSIAIARAVPGRRSGKRCVKPRKGLKRRCTRYAVVATLTRTKTKQGANRVAFTGRLGSRRLKPGAYRATVGAVDAAGNRAKARRVAFRIVRR